MKDRCDHCKEEYEKEGPFNTLSEPIVIDKNEESFHIECWVRKKLEDQGLVLVEKEEWNKLWAYLRHVSHVTDAIDTYEWFKEWYDDELDYTLGGDCW